MDITPQFNQPIEPVPIGSSRRHLWLAISVVAIVACLAFSGIWYWKNSLIIIQGSTLDDINGNLGEAGRSFGYVWYSSLPGIKSGEVLSVNYKDNTTNLFSECVYTEGLQHNYCQAPWPENKYRDI